MVRALAHTEALIDFGEDADDVTEAALSSANTGVALGMWSNDFIHILKDQSEELSVFALGNALHMASGRVSFVFGLQGPNLAVDAACAASLAACHLAARGLQTHECDSHLAIGVNLVLMQTNNVVALKAGMLSPNSKCHTFDSRADGYARGEGCGVGASDGASRAAGRQSTKSTRAPGRSIISRASASVSAASTTT